MSGSPSCVCCATALLHGSHLTSPRYPTSQPPPYLIPSLLTSRLHRQDKKDQKEGKKKGSKKKLPSGNKVKLGLEKKKEKYQRDGGKNKTGKEFQGSQWLRRDIKRQERDVNKASEAAARAEILLPSEAGYLEAEGMERTWRFTQDQLKDHLDERSAKKVFNMELDKFGPYNMDYTKNGRHLVLAGRKGHVALMDWCVRAARLQQKNSG